MTVALLLIHIWMTILTTGIVIYWLHLVQGIPHHTRVDIICMFLFAMIAGMAWPIVFPLAFLLTMIFAVEDIILHIRNSNKNNISKFI